MPRPPLVLDTNAFASKGFRFWLTSYPGEKILPIVAFVELGIHEAGHGRLERFRGLLANSGVEIEWTRVAEADRTIRHALTSGGFADHARDYLIAGHVYGDRVLVTSNLRDFSFLANIASPDDAMKRFR